MDEEKYRKYSYCLFYPKYDTYKHRPKRTNLNFPLPPTGEDLPPPHKIADGGLDFLIFRAIFLFEAQVVLILFLTFSGSEARCSYNIVLIQKKSVF